MSHQHTPSGRAGGTIRPSRFVKQSLTEDNTLLECDAGDAPVGICKDDNLEFDVDNHATDGLPVRLQQGSIMEVECGGAVQRGYPLGPDDEGRAVEGGGGFAIALQSGVAAGDVIEVLFNPTFKSLTVENVTADATLLESESGKLITNLAASGGVKVTLPQSPAVGTYFDFVLSEADELQIDPGAGGAFYIAGAKQSDGISISADDEAESLRVVATAAGDWLTMNVVGTWTVHSNA